MKKNRIGALVVAAVMALWLAMPFAALADEAAAETAAESAAIQAVPAPEATAKDVQEDESAKAAEAVQPVVVETPTAAPEATDSPEGGQAIQPVTPASATDAPVVTPPPASDTAPKPQADVAAMPKDATTLYTVTFVYMSADGVEQKSQETVAAGGSATAPTVPPSYALMGGQTYYFTGWDSAYNNVQSDLTVTARYREATTYTPTIDQLYLANYTGKPDKVVTLELPVIMSKAESTEAPLYSNTLADGRILERWTDKATPDKFDQSLYTSMGINSMKIAIDTTSLSSMPFTSASVTAANAKRAKTYVVQRYNEEASYYSKYGFTGGSVNRGFATFELKVKSSAKNGSYAIPLNVTWNDEYGDHQLVFDAYVQITGEKTSSGGSGSIGGGGTSATEKPVPKARLYIESVRTEPENPKAGDKFTVILTLVNSSKTLYLQNVQMTINVTDDVLRPAGEATNVIYIPKIDANSKREQEFPVESMPDIANKLVKMDVQMDFEDKKLATESVTQTVTVPVLPIQKMKSDEPKLPTGTTYVDQEYEIEIAVANTGKVVLTNLSAEVIGDKDKIMPGTSWYGGNLEGGASKTVSLSPIPLVEGDIPIKVEISYENDMGDKTVETKELTISATKEDDYEYDPNEFLGEPEPEPEKVTPMSILSVLPKELYMAAGALVLLIIVSMAVSARKRRKRAMEDDEMD